MSATWLLALGETFMTVPDEPRPFIMARRFFPRFAGHQAGGPAPAMGARDGGAAEAAAGARRGVAAGQQPPGLGAEAARAKWQR